MTRGHGAATARSAGGDVAVIDVGSNSVRLVVYRIDGRDFAPILNDRAAAGLGRELTATGRLSEEGVDAALAAARRFKLFLDARRVKEVRVVGTAAVRDAEDAPRFVADFETAVGAKVRVLSGEQEGRYAGLGVLAGDPGARGVIADLGGSSLELAAVEKGEVGRPVTLPLGVFALDARSGGEPKAVRGLIDEALANIDLARPEGGALYVVGGAWRNFAKIAMARRDYPLRILQSYEMSVDEAVSVARFLAKQSPPSISRMQEVSRRRAETMPFAAAALDRLVKKLGVSAVRVSAYGMREGVLLETMSAKVRRQDPMLAGAEAIARNAGAEPAFGRALVSWIEPLVPLVESGLPEEQEARLIGAACRLADVSGLQHPDHRAELAAHRVLFAPIAGASHIDRVFLSRVMHHRYAGRKDPPDSAALDRLLSPEAREGAQKTGLALRLAGSVSGRTASLLAESRLEAREGVLRLVFSRRGADLATDIVEKRLAQLAEALGRPALMDIE